MIDMTLQNYVDFKVNPVMKIKNSYGYRIILSYEDGSAKTKQRSGFATIKEAKKDRDITVTRLHSGTFCVHDNVKLSEFMEFWLEKDIKERVRSHETYYNFGRIVKNHINPFLGRRKMESIGKSDVQELYKRVSDYSVSVARVLKTVMKLSMNYAVRLKVISSNPTEGVRLPKRRKEGSEDEGKNGKRTLTYEQILLLIEKSKDTPIHLQVLMNVLMGLRRSEIIGVKYSDIDYINRSLFVKRQLGISMEKGKDEVFPKTYTKQEISLKTESGMREVPIPDLVFDEILKERERYLKNKRRRSKDFKDLDYICCSTYGRPRSRNFHWKHYKALLKECGLPDIRWHDLRTTFCTLLLKNDFNVKAVSKLMGHSKELITVDVYGDKKAISTEPIPELEAYIKEVTNKKGDLEDGDYTDTIPDIDEYR